MIAIDGKTIRRSFDTATAKSALHLVSAWSAANQTVIGQMRVEGHENEIPGILRLLNITDIHDSTVSIDAIGAQRTIAEKIIKSDAE